MASINTDRTERGTLRRVALAAIETLLAQVKGTSGGRKLSIFDRMEQLTKRVRLRDPGPTSPGQPPTPSMTLESDDPDSVVRNFEKTLWDAYGLNGIIVPDELLKECQRRLRAAPPGSLLESDTKEELSFLDLLHQYRKTYSLSFALGYPAEIWRSAKKVEPRESMRSKGSHFWAVIIGNDRYQRAPLGGCINDARLVMRFITTYLGVRKDHIRFLEDADRDTITNVLYDLRDDKNIQHGDNILIHYSGHGSSYPAKDYFTTAASQAGSIEAICPVDRGDVPDISERELNSILSEIRAAKGPNITVVLDCCHSGGTLRTLENTVRFIPPVLGKEELQKMFKAAECHPRRRNSSTLSSEHWEADISSFVQLAACQDFQVAEEFNIAPSDEDPSLSERGMKLEPYGLGSLTRRSPRFGRFTWALVKVLESDKGINATYASVMSAIGRLGHLQVPVVVGSRKDSQLWFEESGLQDLPLHK